MNDFDNLNNRPDDEQQNNINENNTETQGFEEKTSQQENVNSVNDEIPYRNDSPNDVNQGSFTQNTNYYPYSNTTQNNQPYGFNQNNQANQPNQYNQYNQGYNYRSPEQQANNQYNGYYSQYKRNNFGGVCHCKLHRLSRIRCRKGKSSHKNKTVKCC